MPPFVEGVRFELPDIPILVVEDPFLGRLSNHKFFAFFGSRPTFPFTDFYAQASEFLGPRVLFGLGDTSKDAGADLIARNSCPLVSIRHPVIQGCISKLPTLLKCCPYQHLDIRFCKEIMCQEEMTDFVLEINLSHIHVECKSCHKKHAIKFMDKDFSLVPVFDATMTLEGYNLSKGEQAFDRPWR